jgi:hypothetical protein
MPPMVCCALYQYSLYEREWSWACCAALLTCLQLFQPLESRVWPDGIPLTALTINQDLRLRSVVNSLVMRPPPQPGKMDLVH